MDNLNLLSQLRESLVNALREIRAGHLKRAIHEVEDAFATSTTMLGLKPQGGGPGGPAVMQDGSQGGSSAVTIPGKGGNAKPGEDRIQGGMGTIGIPGGSYFDPDGRNLQQGVHEFPSQGAAGPPGHSGPGLSLDEARAIQRAGGEPVPDQPRYAAEYVGEGPGGGGGNWGAMHGNCKIVDEHGQEVIQVRKTPEWQMNLAKTTQARYIADLVTLENWAEENAGNLMRKRIRNELIKEFDAFDERLLEELKDG